MKTNKVAIYARVSTLNQAEEGYSINEQIDSLTKYCDAMSWEVVHQYVDAGYSGGKLERPDITKLISDAKNKKFDTVLVFKLDRLSRSVRDTLYLVKDVFTENKIGFVSLKENIDTSTAMGNLFLTMLSAIAEFEREQIKERMQFGLAGRAKSGKPTSWKTPPYGYTYDKNLQEMVVNEYEANNVREMFDMIISGHSLMQITHYARDHYPGNTWTHVKVKRILENEAYIGLVKLRNERYKGNHERIISDEIFIKAQNAIEERTNASDNTRPFQGKYMLSHIAKCGYCGAPLKIDTSKPRKDGTRRQTYTCVNKFKARATNGATIYNNGKICESGRYDAKTIEKFVIEEIRKIQIDKDFLKSKKQKSNIDNDIAKKEISKIENKIEKLNDLYINDLIALDDLKKKTSDLKKEISKINKSINEEIIDSVKQNALNELESNIDISKSSYEVQKRIVKLIVDRVEVTNDNINIILKF